jgi:sortase A
MGLKRRLHWTERALFITGATTLATVFMLWEQTYFVQLRARGDLQQMLAVRNGAADAPASRPAPAAASESVLGYLEIPRLEFLAPVLEGVDDRTLSLAAGHLPGTAPPWEFGNTGIAGHRDTFFRALRRLRVGDEIALLTPRGDFHYRVRTLAIVDPAEVSVLNAADGVHLTLITCYPFTYVGPSPKRFIVHGERTDASAPLHGTRGAG